MRLTCDFSRGWIRTFDQAIILVASRWLSGVVLGCSGVARRAGLQIGRLGSCGGALDNFGLQRGARPEPASRAHRAIGTFTTLAKATEDTLRWPRKPTPRPSGEGINRGM